MGVYTIIMFALAVVTLFFAGLMYIGETGWLRTFERVNYKDKKDYARYLGKSVALIALSFLLSGIVSLFAGIIIPVIVLIVGIVLSIIWMTKHFSEHTL